DHSVQLVEIASELGDLPFGLNCSVTRQLFSFRPSTLELWASRLVPFFLDSVHALSLKSNTRNLRIYNIFENLCRKGPFGAVSRDPDALSDPPVGQHTGSLGKVQAIRRRRSSGLHFFVLSAALFLFCSIASMFCLST
ncbi:hypothetical protein H5410_051159, partial [Solanum commersonii]